MWSYTSLVAAIVLRVSSDEQRERCTVDTQRLQIERFCSTHNITIYAYYVDEGVSGKIPLHERPQGALLLHEARQHRFNVVLVYAFDRLGRGDAAVLTAVWELLDLGIDIRSILQPDIDLRIPRGWHAFLQEIHYAEYERHMYQQRSNAGTDRLVRAGAWVGGIVPYGYRVNEHRKRDNLRGLEHRKAGRLVPATDPLPNLDVSEVDVVRMIFHLCADQQWSCPKIAEHLNSLGILPAYASADRKILRGKRRTRTVGVWRAGRILSMLRNTTYKGWHTYGKRSNQAGREIIERQVEPLVDDALWQRAQQVLRDNRVRPIAAQLRQSLLRGLMTCSLCGLTYSLVSTSRNSSGPDAYYMCNGRHQHRKLQRPGGPCPSKDLPRLFIETAIWHHIVGLLQAPQDTLTKVQAQRLSNQQTVLRSRDESIAHRSIFMKIETAQAELLQQYYQGSLNEHELDQRLAALEVEANDHRDTIERLLQSATVLEQSDAILAEIEALLTMPDGRDWFALPPLQQRELFELLITEIHVNTLFSRDGKKTAEVLVTYRFGEQSIVTVANRIARKTYDPT